MNTEFTDQLTEAMTRHPAPVPPDLVKKVRRRYRRRRATIWSAAVGGTAAVTGLAVVLATQAAPAPVPVARVDPTTAYVVSHMTKALESIGANSILYERTTYLHPDSGLPPEQSWSILSRTRSQSFTSTGRLETDETLTETATTTTHVVVDYQTRTWSRISSILPSESASPSVPPPSCADGAPRGWNPDPSGEAAELRTAVSCGFLVSSTGGIVDGVGTIKLSERPGATTMTFWVDAKTFLPVRIVQVWAAHDLAEGDLRMDLQWLPATPANKAKLILHIPAGFKRVPWG